MTARTLWTIILKIFGLYILIQVFLPVTQLFSILIAATGPQAGTVWEVLVYLLLSIGLYLLMVWLFIFKTDLLIDKLKLEKSIDEEKIEINIHRSTVLTLAVLLSGILMLADNLPQLLKELNSYLYVINAYVHFKDYPRASFIIVEFVRTLVAIFMLSCCRLIVNFIERKRRKTVVLEDKV